MSSLRHIVFIGRMHKRTYCDRDRDRDRDYTRTSEVVAEIVFISQHLLKSSKKIKKINREYWRRQTKRASRHCGHKCVSLLVCSSLSCHVCVCGSCL
jgi:hypothetical protein